MGQQFEQPLGVLQDVLQENKFFSWTCRRKVFGVESNYLVGCPLPRPATGARLYV